MSRERDEEHGPVRRDPVEENVRGLSGCAVKPQLRDTNVTPEPVRQECQAESDPWQENPGMRPAAVQGEVSDPVSRPEKVDVGKHGDAKSQQHRRVRSGPGRQRPVQHRAREPVA